MFQFLAVVFVALFCVPLQAQSQQLKLPFTPGKDWVVTRGYYSVDPYDKVQCQKVTTHCEKDKFALDFATGNCGDTWGELVLADGDGVVKRARQDTKDGKTTFVNPKDGKTYGVGYGKNVWIDHPDGRRTLIGHMAEYYVKVDDDVVQGQVIGRAGDTGYVLSSCVDDHKGAHIHYVLYEVTSNGTMIASNPDGMSGYETFGKGLVVHSDNTPIWPADVGSPEPPPPPGSTSSEVAAGQFKSDDVAADANISQAFRVAYAGQTDSTTGFNKLGAPDPAVYYPYVIEYAPGLDIFLQQFHQADSAKPRFIGGPAETDGWTRLVYGRTTGRAYVVSPIFLTTYAAQDIAAVFGAPFNNEHIWTGPSGLVLPGYNNYIRQDFSLGKTMIAQAVAAGLPAEVRVIDTPPGPLHISLVDGVGGAEPFTLTGWPVSNHQVALTCRGNLELDANGWYSWLRDGVEVSQTALPEFTELNLTPGATYTYSVQAVDDVWGVVDVSTDLTITMPPAEEFSLHVELRTANSVSLSITNHRFAVVGYYAVYRDGVLIAKLSGEAAGDYDLEYSRTYTYEAVAMTASHMELGRTEVVSVTTQAQPAAPEVPLDPSHPASIVLTTDLSEIPAFTRAQATVEVSDQYGRQMLGPRVLYLSSSPAVATIDADRGDIIAEAEGQVELWAELYDNRDLRSAPVVFTVHRADWVPPIPPVWRGIKADRLLGSDSASRHWSDLSHQAWWSPTDISAPAQWLTSPIVLWCSQLYVQPQYYETGNPNPVDGFTWYPADGRLGVYFKTIHGCELWVNGQKVGEWGNPNAYGRNPINRPDLPDSINLPPVEITPYLIAGVNYLVLHITAGSGAAELTHLEFVNLNAAQNINLPNSGSSPSGAVVFSDDFNRGDLGSSWEACGSVALSANGTVDVVGDNSCTMCGFGSVAGIRRVNFPALPQPEAVLELFIANNYGGRNNIVYLAFGNFWVGASAHPQAQPVVQIFYRGNELARQTGTRLASGWYQLAISGGVARFSTLRLQNAGDTAIDLEGSFTDWIDPADPPYISHLCLSGNELGNVSFDDVIVYDLTQPASLPPTTVPPNLVPALSLEETTIAADDQPNALVTVVNRSSADSSSSRLSLTVDGFSERTFMIPELAASGTHTFFVALDRLLEGDHVVAVVADSDSQIVESDETDNGVELTFTVAPTRRSDLLVSALAIPVQGYIGDDLPINAIVHNRGDAPSSPCLLNLGFGGTTEESVYDAQPGALQFIVPELAPGAEVSFSSSLRLAAADTFTLWADVDANAEIRELDETNNSASVSVLILAYPLLASLPSPQYAFSRTEDYTTSSGVYTAYRFTCLNWTDYPDVIFRSEPTVVCGTPGASRTWVRMWAVNTAGSKSYLCGYCRFGSAQDLNSVSFSLPRGSLPPSQICVTLTDEVDHAVLTSNVVSVPRPSANDAWDPADNTVSGAVAVSNPTATERSHGPHRLASTDYYDWFKVYLTGGRSYNFNTIGGTGDDLGELYSNAVGTTRVAYNDDSGGNLQFSLTYKPSATGWYYLRVRAFSVGRSCSYTLKYRQL